MESKLEDQNTEKFKRNRKKKKRKGEYYLNRDPQQQQQQHGRRRKNQRRVQPETELNKKKVFIRNIPLEIDREEVSEIFEECGKVRTCVLFGYGGSNWRGLGLVEFENEEDARKAIRLYNNRPISKTYSNAIGVEFFRELIKKNGENQQRRRKYVGKKRDHYFRSRDSYEHRNDMQQLQEGSSGGSKYNTLKVRPLSLKTTQPILRKQFQKFGVLMYANIVEELAEFGESNNMQRLQGGKMERVGYVQFTDPRDCRRAQTSLDGKEFDGVKLRVIFQESTGRQQSSSWDYQQYYQQLNLSPNNYYDSYPSREGGKELGQQQQQQRVFYTDSFVPRDGVYNEMQQQQYYSSASSAGTYDSSYGGNYYTSQQQQQQQQQDSFSFSSTSRSFVQEKYHTRVDNIHSNDDVTEIDPNFRQKVGGGNNNRKNIQKNCNLFVFHLPQDVDDTSLNKIYSGYGEIKSVKVIRDDRGLSKGYGFVMFKDHTTAEEALKGTDGLKVGNKYLKVSYKTNKRRTFKDKN